MMDDDDDINISIPVKPIWEEFTCPICYSPVQECYMTNCSHNFCKECITEWLDRKNQCPCCNAKTTKQALSPNKQFDRILSIINEEKEKSSKNYFEKLINGAQQPNNGVGVDIQNTQPLSPIEKLFHSHIKKSLSNYEEYYKKLKQKHDSKVEAIKKSYTEKMINYNKNAGKKSVKANVDAQIADWKLECDNAVNELEDSFQKSIDLLLKSYDDYMKNVAPAPQFLPVNITITIPTKGLKIPAIQLNPTDTLLEIKAKLRERMEKLGDPIMCFEKSNIFLLVNAPELGRGDTKIIHDENVPLVQFGPEPGAILEVQGNLKCKSDAPKQCFKATYIKDAPNQKMDYFTCKDCKINWICKPCVESCHKNHTTIDYILDHKPTWACCYCAKNPLLCKLFKKE